MKQVWPICVRPRLQLPEASRARIYHQTISYSLLQHPLDTNWLSYEEFQILIIFAILELFLAIFKNLPFWVNLGHLTCFWPLYGHFKAWSGFGQFVSVLGRSSLRPPEPESIIKLLVIAFYSILYDPNWPNYEKFQILIIFVIFIFFGHFYGLKLFLFYRLMI